MSDMQDLADVWFGGKARRAEVSTGEDTTTTRTMTATAVADSEGGTVRVILSDTVIPDEDPVSDSEDAPPTPEGDEDAPVYDTSAGDLGEVAVELPTAVDVREGDEVLVSTYGSGAQTSPVITSVTGGGDRTRGEVEEAQSSAADAAKSATSAAEMATEAAEAVLATSQHFFSDDAGAHVATTAGEPDTGPNSLWNSEGLLIRDGSNPLTAVTPSGLSVYDGEGTAESNVVALLSKDTVELGRGNTAARVSMVDDKARVWAETSGTSSAVFLGTPTASDSSIALTTYDSRGLPSDQGIGIAIDTDGTTLAAVTASKITFNGIVYTPAMSHAKQTFKAAYSGMSFDGNTIELSVTRGIATIRIDIGFKKSGSVASYGNVLTSDLETAIMSWATPPDGGLQFTFQDLSRTSTWMASLNVTAGKCYLWPSAKFTPTTTTYVNGTFTWPVAY